LEESHDQYEEEIETACIRCGHATVEPEYRMRLCSDCRTQLSAYPVPPWIKMVAVAVLALLITALIQFPTRLDAAVSYEQGKLADKQMKYATAASKYEVAAEQYKDSKVVQARLFLAYYHAGKIDEADEVFRKIAGQSLGDDALTDNVNAAVDRMGELFYMDDDLQSIMSNDQLTLQERIDQLQAYATGHPSVPIGKYLLADQLFDANEYESSLAITEALVAEAPDFEQAYLLAAAGYREQGDYDTALDKCQAVIDRNPESAGAYYTKTRIELKAHRDEQALQDALMARDLGSDESYAVYNLALAYHYHGDAAERDKLVQELHDRRDFPADDLQELEDIIAGKMEWRT